MVIINTTGKQNQVWLDKPYGTVECPEVDEAYRSGFTAGVEDQKSKLSSLSVSGNGEYVSEDGFSAVTVDVPQQEVHLENLVKTFSANGIYDIAVHSGYDGFKSPGRVYVEVPQTGQTINNQDKEVFLDNPTFGTVAFPDRRTGWYTQEVIVTADSGYTGLGTVSAYTTFEPTEAISFGEERQKEKLIAETFSANGTYDRVDGWERVTVDVPQEYTPKDIAEAFQSGYTSGRTDGYDRGVTDGVDLQKLRLGALTVFGNGTYTRADGYSAVTVDVQTGHTDEEMEDSWNSGYTSGRTDGYDDGWRPGYNSGYTDGINAAGGDYTSGYTDGFDAGYDSGVTDGYESGHTDGYDERAAMLTAMTITANGAYESVEGWSAVTVNVSGYSRQDLDNAYASGHTSGVTDGVAQQKALLASTAFTTNGTYTRPDGWSAVTVNVPQTGYTQEDLDNAYGSGWTGGYDSGYTDGMEECQPTTATSISVSVPALEPGETGNTNVSITPGGAFTRLVFTSSDNNVATIDTAGTITAIGTGNTNICVEDTVSQLTSCAVLTVVNPVSGSADLTATVQAKTASQSVLISTDENLASVNKMAIDGVDITPVSAYTFGDTEPHTLEVWYLSSTIPYAAYQGAAQLKNVVINDRMTVIGGRAFFNCTGITSVHLGSGMTNLGNSSFQGCKSLTGITIPNSVTIMGTYVFKDCPGMTTAIFGTGITKISSGTMQDCKTLQSVTINGAITEISIKAFDGCSMLDNVVLPNSLITIYENAFLNCTSLTSIQIPNSVTGMGKGVFQGCTAMTMVSISSGLTGITENMFSGCSSLTGVVLPDTIKTIGASAFNACGKMTGITLSSGLTRIDDNAFRYCTYLRGIDIPATIERIGAYAFQFDAALPVYGITVRNSVPCEIGTSAFASTGDAPIYVPAGSVETYKTSTASGYYWATYANRIQAIQE